MSALSMSQFIGKIGTVNQGGLYVDVKVIDAKQAYGCMRLQVTPMAGIGTVWVAVERVHFDAAESVQS